ncbi:MAG: o-succinylbenzoate synthase [Actinomycetes bacterium]
MFDLPGLTDLLETATPFALPLRRTFRGLDVRDGVLLRGPVGWGEFAPFDDYDDVAAGRWLRCAIEAAYGQWPEPVRATIRVNAILPSLAVAEARDWTLRARDEFGVRTVKVKVAESSPSEDLARLVAVREVLGSEGRIRIDGNGRWTLTEAEAILPQLVRAAGGVEYVEQPLDQLGDMRRLRESIGVPLAVDEGLRRAPDLSDPALPELIRAAGDVLVLKAGPLGGVAVSIELAKRIGLPVVVSGALDSSVGLAAGLALAAGIADLPLDCGLGTGALLAADLVDQTTLPTAGALAIGRRAPDADALAAAAAGVAPVRQQWWVQRLSAAYGTLVP